MEIVLFSFAGLALSFGAMALGVLLGRAPLRRGCAPDEGDACGACTRPCPRRRSPARAEARP